MRKSNVFISILFITILAGLFMSNSALKKAYDKIDLSDPFMNYASYKSELYSVLDISGSNGYPIKVVQSDSSRIKVLRSRLKHFNQELRNDTLFVSFTGSNIPIEQRINSNTPYGIIIENSKLKGLVSTNMHSRLYDFNDTAFQILLKGNSFMEMTNCKFSDLKLSLKQSSYVRFFDQNIVDALELRMTETATASIQQIDFNRMTHHLSDSVSIVLSKDAFDKILN